jgi:hypothetical protein
MTAEQLRTFRMAVKVHREFGSSLLFYSAMRPCYDAFGVTDDQCEEHGITWCLNACRPILFAVMDCAAGVRTARELKRLVVPA